MKRNTFIAGAACILLAVSAAAAAKPDFSGTWVMDKNKSLGIPPGMEQTMTVTQTEEKITVEIKIKTAQGERIINDVYVPDGKETEFTPQGPQGPAGKGKRKSYWSPKGNALIISEQSTVDTPNGPVDSWQTRKWQMAADGSTLYIDLHIDGPRGSGESKRVFVKK